MIPVFVFIPNVFPDDAADSPPETILRIWNIDTFEGGKGSRTAFLNRAALRYGKAHNIHFLVSSLTAEGAEIALSQGNCPDLISYGPGVPAIADVATSESYVWCYGKYCLFSKPGTDGLPNSENTLISENGNALSVLAWRYLNMSESPPVMDSVAAYVKFMQSKEASFFLGTQRDVFRFRSREFSVEVSALADFTDLMQYIVITATQEEEFAAAMGFCKYLLSSEMQQTLTDIGMFSLYGEIYSPEDSMHDLEKTVPLYTVSPYLTQEEVKRLRSRILTEGRKVAENYLKGIEKSFEILYNKGD